MTEHYLYGPIPSRRLGTSLGISLTDQKTCNLSCIYCQLGHTYNLEEDPQAFVNLEDLFQAFEAFLTKDIPFDVVSIVGNGEPMLEINLKAIIQGLKTRTDKPIALVTNGTLFHEQALFDAALEADIVLPTLCGFDEASFKRIHRPHPSLSFKAVFHHLKRFTHSYQGELWLEIMFMKDINDSDDAIKRYQSLLKKLTYTKLYLNTVIRPPAKASIAATTHEKMMEIEQTLQGIAIDYLSKDNYHSHLKDHLEAIKSLIKRHPMHQFEIEAFLKTRQEDSALIFKQLKDDASIEVIVYKGYQIYRMKE